MHLSTLRVTNYKSFADSGPLHFKSGFNVVVGRNNVGKTTIAEAVSLRFSDKPHHSLNTVPTPDVQPNPEFHAEFSIEFEAGELAELLVREISTFYVPTDPNSQGPGQAALQTELSDGLTVEAEFHNQGVHSSRLATYKGIAISGSYLRVTVDQTGEPTYVGPIMGVPNDYPQLDAALASKFYNRLCSFSAVRFGIDENSMSTNTVLQPDTSNLVQVLDLLSRNPSRWQRYFDRVRTVLPEIEAITFVPSDRGGAYERALLWNVDPSTEREDLAVPLSESGTGVGQVLAILYVVFASDYPRTIVIDEPQSFLHPGAIRKLFEILKDYPQHQYVVTTHTPNVVTAADPSALFFVRKEGEQSVVEEIDAATVRQQGHLLREVGATLSDVFGGDNVLWVEGATEEECFPIIIKKLLDRRLLGTRVIGVAHTSDFERKHQKTALNIYTGLSGVKGLLPPTIGFILDREKRSDREREVLEEQSGGKTTLTSLRTYENYLLNSCAIAYFASRIDGFREETSVSSEEVEDWIEEYRWDAEYFDTQVEMFDRTNNYWLSEVDRARLLEDMFYALSGKRVTYGKVEHGIAFTRWLCDNALEDLEELKCLIEERLDQR